MKIVLDVDQLLQNGQITPEEYAWLNELAVQESGSLAFNILIGFGVIATAGGALALLPHGATAIVLGFVLAGAGDFLSTRFKKEWGLLGSMLLLVGALAASGGILSVTDGNVFGFLIVTALCLVGSLLAKSGLLATIAVLALSSTVGAMTAYGHASYGLCIRQPTITVCLFTLIAVGAYQVSKLLSWDYQRLAIIVSRTSLFVVNLGFWVGSLWGDSLWYQLDSWDFGPGAVISDLVFVIAWAVALILTGLWAVKANKRWVINVLAVFGAIHFYTQYFERLGASPGSVMIAGLVAMGIAFAIVRYNKSAVMAEARPEEIAQ